jgi:hypothetical protein
MLIDVAIDDPRLDAFRGVRDRELRGTLGLHAIESERVVRRFLTASVRRRELPIPPVLEPLALLVTPDSAERLTDITAEFPSLAIYRCTDERALHAITGYTMHSGAIALGVRHEDGSVDELMSCLARDPAPPNARDVVVALDGITQTDNVGAIFRNAASFGARAVLLSPVSPASLFVGKALGALVFVLLETWLAQQMQHWKLLFGPVLVLAVIFLRGGLSGLVARRG